ncbi:MAG TPA: mechanosensitive ion channel family protein [Candidatus Absconditabacterales bacterium]|nr:mechanosensitive ion channel family protein [Candidatus Absconditabacterales bacterium]HNG97133.1 mechanosensitive ion channel family protein [Candidatus Absconditabacterales bacterium]
MNKTTTNPGSLGSNSKTTSLIPGQDAGEPSLLYQIINADYVSYIWKVGLAIVAFFVLYLISKWIANRASKKFYQHANSSDLNKQETVGQLIYDVVFYILLIIAVFVAFQIVGFDVGVILGGISFGVGFAFKEVLGNMIAGVMVLNIKELKLGDIIQIDGKPGYFGKIEEITIRYTIIRTLDLRQVVIPNMELISNPIKTYSSEELIKLNTVIPISYYDDLDKAMNVMVDAVNTMDIVHDKKKTKAFISEYGDAGVMIKLFFWIDPNCGMPMDYIIGDVNAIVVAGLRRAGFKLPYKRIVPTTDQG